GMRIRSTENESTQDIDLQGVYIAIGQQPNTQCFDGQLNLKDGQLKIRSGSDGNANQTSIEGEFASGDVADNVHGQAITSADAGCMAALDAEKYLDNLG